MFCRLFFNVLSLIFQNLVNNKAIETRRISYIWSANIIGNKMSSELKQERKNIAKTLIQSTTQQIKLDK